jgi:23S rRNA (cytosine1962-C5)-methyltransferase
LDFWIKPTTFKHLGIFPEQVANWEWIKNLISAAKRKISVMNLFGYTGGATLAASSGAEVCHVDGSRVAITWARENAALSKLDKKPIRWILDDAVKFVRQEIKRGRHYDGIIMDPPAFGHGPGGELWKIEDNFLELINMRLWSEEWRNPSLKIPL